MPLRQDTMNVQRVGFRGKHFACVAVRQQLGDFGQNFQMLLRGLFRH